MVKTYQFTTKCKSDRVITLKQQKSKYMQSLNYNHKHKHWVLYLNQVIDRFKCYSACVLWLQLSDYFDSDALELVFVALTLGC